MTGKSGEAIAYSTTSQITEFKKQGYNLVSDEFTAGGAKVYDYDTARDQVYTVTLSERIERVTPKDPKPQPYPQSIRDNQIHQIGQALLREWRN